MNGNKAPILTELEGISGVGAVFCAHLTESAQYDIIKRYICLPVA